MAIIGMFDILGFRESIRQLNERELSYVVRRYGEGMDEVLNLATNAPSSAAKTNSTHAEREPLCNHARFSDSILLWSTQETPEATKNLILASTALMGLSVRSGTLLRGAITRGSLVKHPRQLIFLGEGLVRAYELEQAQDWAGAILDVGAGRIGRTLLSEGALADLVRKGLLHPYAPPLKHGPVSTHYCLGWPHGIKDSVSKFHQRMIRHAPEDWPARRKVIATADYYRDYQEQREPMSALTVKGLRDLLKVAPSG